MSAPRKTPGLSYAAAKRCENAEEPVCKCRCGGTAHGARRVAGGGWASEFSALDATDPHYVPPERVPGATCPRCSGKFGKKSFPSLSVTGVRVCRWCSVDEERIKKLGPGFRMVMKLAPGWTGE